MRKQLLKSLVILGLIAGLMIPIQIVKTMVHERRTRYDNVVEEMNRGWGRPVIIGGLYLMSGDDRIAAENIRIDCRLKTEVRKKGIFKVPCYTAEVVMDAEFNAPENEKPCVLGISFAHNGRFLLDSVMINGAAAEKRISDINGSGSLWHHDITRTDSGQTVKTCSVKFRLRGTEKITFRNNARNFHAGISADWGDPNFFGTLPAVRNISKKNFSAVWEVSGDTLFSDTFEAGIPGEEDFGVSLFVPQSIYQQTDRVIKYALLFIVLTFGIFFTFENVTSMRIHPFQYLLVGASLTFFYLLLLSLSEHIAFSLSYLAASAAVVALISMYCRSVLGETGRALAIGIFLSLLYAFLFVLILLQEYSLLLGSAGVFVLLSGTMYLTRNIDWYGTAVSD